MGQLYETALDNLRGYFVSTQHEPTKDQWEALADLLKTLEAMADGRLPRSYYVSSLDPGVGKTRAVVALVTALVSIEQYKSTGIMIGLSRKAEIESLVQECGLLKRKFSVLTADPDLNSLGALSRNGAQVLFTTQQMIQSRCWERSFEKVPEFYFKGSPRVVRIWDESMLPAEPVCLARDVIARTFLDLRSDFPHETEQLEDLFNGLRTAKDGEIVEIGDSISPFGMNVREILRRGHNLENEVRDHLRQLASISGQRLTARHDDYTKQTLLVGHADTVPKEFAPIVILDASARVLHTYRLWQKHRKTLVFLKSATKDYKSLTVHWWKKGGGRSSIAGDIPTYANAIAETINGSEEAEWLVFLSKPRTDGKDLQQALEVLVDASRHTVHYVTWGSHRATNKYVTVPNIVLAGTLFYQPAQYEALTRAASGPSVECSPVDPEIIEKVTQGESLHHILQAACRGSIRKTMRGDTRTCNVYLIASWQSRIGEALHEAFPGCRVADWNPLGLKLPKKASQVADYLLSRFAKEPFAAVGFKEVMKAIGIMHASQLAVLRKGPAFVQWMEENQVEETGGKKRMTGFRRTTHPWDF